MFLHREGDDGSSWIISQASHTWLAWQLAAHWGNRRFPRPAPKAEFEAAVLLHDGGWVDFDSAPPIDGEGRPVTFDRMEIKTHLSIWRGSVTRAAGHSRYAGLLVAAHFARLVGYKEAELEGSGDQAGLAVARAFKSEMESLQVRWAADLQDDDRYEGVLEGPGRALNASVLAACDLMSVQLCASMNFSLPIRAIDTDGAWQVIGFTDRGDGAFKVAPWPFEGPRVKVHCEGRRMGRVRFESNEAFGRAFESAPTERLTFVFQRPGSLY